MTVFDRSANSTFFGSFLAASGSCVSFCLSVFLLIAVAGASSCFSEPSFALSSSSFALFLASCNNHFARCLSFARANVFAFYY